MTADEIIAKANPCDCGHDGNVHYKSVNGWHALICSYCGDGVCVVKIDELLGTWNDDNPLPEPKPMDAAWQQVTELAQAGKMTEATALYQSHVIKPQPSAIDTALRAHVKKTADELPEPTVDVLIWNGSAWIQAWYDDDEDDWTIEGDCDYPLEGGKYWLPLPTFDPESEG